MTVLSHKPRSAIGSVIVLTGSLFAIAACTTTHVTKTNYAEENGASIGGQAATDVSNPLLRALNGGLIGGSVADQLNRADRAKALEAEYRALEYAPGGKAVDWNDPATGLHGEVIAAQPYQVGSQNCRQYTHTIYIGGVPQVARGTACRNQDGSWTPLT